MLIPVPDPDTARCIPRRSYHPLKKITEPKILEYCVGSRESVAAEAGGLAESSGRVGGGRRGSLEIRPSQRQQCTGGLSLINSPRQHHTHHSKSCAIRDRESQGRWRDLCLHYIWHNLSKSKCKTLLVHRQVLRHRICSSSHLLGPISSSTYAADL